MITASVMKGLNEITLILNNRIAILVSLTQIPNVEKIN